MIEYNCKCKNCNKKFKSLISIANICSDCTDISIVFIDKDNGEEYFIDVPRYLSDQEKKRLIDEGHKNVRKTDKIQTAF